MKKAPCGAEVYAFGNKGFRKGFFLIPGTWIWIWFGTRFHAGEYGTREPGVRTAIRIADALGVEKLQELFAAEPEEDQKTHAYHTTDSRQKQWEIAGEHKGRKQDV